MCVCVCVCVCVKIKKNKKILVGSLYSLAPNSQNIQ